MAELYEKCLRVGLRMTLPRKIILEVIEAADDHPDVDEMYRRAVEKDRSISIATVYRTIKLFEEAGIIEKLDIGDGRSRYEEAGEHHEHLIDVESGEIIEFSVSPMAATAEIKAAQNRLKMSVNLIYENTLNEDVNLCLTSHHMRLSPHFMGRAGGLRGIGDAFSDHF